MKLPKQAQDELDKLRALSNSKLKKERRNVEKLLSKMKDERLNLYKLTSNLLILIKLVQEERKKKK